VVAEAEVAAEEAEAVAAAAEEAAKALQDVVMEGVVVEGVVGRQRVINLSTSKFRRGSPRKRHCTRSERRSPLWI